MTAPGGAGSDEKMLSTLKSKWGDKYDIGLAAGTWVAIRLRGRAQPICEPTAEKLNAVIAADFADTL